MPFPPINLHQRITSPGRDLFRKKKTNAVPLPTSALALKPGGEEKPKSEKDKFTRSWPAANLRNLGRKSSQQQKTKSPTRIPALAQEERTKCSWLPVSKSQDSCGVVTRSSSMESTTARGCSKQSSRGSLGRTDYPAAVAEKEIQFSLSLTPEAILVIQKRNLEKQMLAKQQKCCLASTDLRHRRIFPSKKAHGHGGSGTGSKGCGAPLARLDDAEQDIRAIVKISLLNDQYKYDDVEYEEEDGNVDETVVRKCKEWLKGVESAAAFGKVDRLSTLPTLKGC
ncbi:proline-rich protein 18 [Gadus macrocephalus]|uniref:proline-rich protein 18 n=1 Tax=Gadus macrocephalus TaxID=80720 RepID=UPI0028CBB81A|nr:proline-rich protein 18 [Gadus macrocephalus]